MGTTTYAVCHTCRQYIDLDKFYSFATLEMNATPAEMEKWCHGNRGFDYDALRRARMEAFLAAHPKHSLQIDTEYNPELDEVCRDARFANEGVRTYAQVWADWPQGSRIITHRQMTWGEFKTAIEAQGVTDATKLTTIACYFDGGTATPIAHPFPVEPNGRAIESVSIA